MSTVRVFFSHACGCRVLKGLGMVRNDLYGPIETLLGTRSAFVAVV